MKKLLLFLIFSFSCSIAIAQEEEAVPLQQQLIKISDLGTLIEPIVHAIANRDWRSEYIGIGIHYERLITNRLSFIARGEYSSRVGFMTLQSAGQPAVTVRSREEYASTVFTGIRSYFRKNKFNHYNGIFTGGYVAYSYHKINTVNHLNVLHIGVPLGYQHKLYDRFTIEFEYSTGYGLFTNLEHRPPGGSVTEHATSNRYMSIHIALGYVF